MKIYVTDNMKPKYTKEEIWDIEHNYQVDREIDIERLPFLTLLKWSLFGPPGSTGPQ
jgi:hypothetical protein